MNKAIGLLTLFLAVSMAIMAQDLTVSPVSAAPGDVVQIEISLQSPPGRVPVALKWEMIVPSHLRDAEDGGPKIGGAAKNSGKSVSCAAHNAHSYICILFGGENPVANGSVAAFCFKIRKDTPLGTTAVRLQQVEAVDGDSQSFVLKNAEAAVTIR
jgi:hypothetical protein